VNYFAGGAFRGWCDERRLSNLRQVQAIQVAAHIETLQAPRIAHDSPSSFKMVLHPACVKAAR
jgi:hypothetical protein